MLRDNQKKRVLIEVKKFRGEVTEYVQKKSELDRCEKNLRMKNEELLKVAEEERQIEVAMEVLYGQAEKESKARKIEEEIESWRQKLETLRNELTQLKTDLLGQMRNLPIPANLENPKQEESGMAFPFFEDAELGKEGIDTICDLFGQEPPLEFGDVTILLGKVMVRNASTRQEAIPKLVEAIRSFRMRVDDTLKSYEQIDEMVERLKKSKQYAGVLKVLAREGKLSSNEIASFLKMDKRRAYDACYNLTRSNWSPSPIQRVSSGEWELTLPGKILVNRLLERFPEGRSELGSEEVAETG